jgi:MFS family permease
MKTPNIAGLPQGQFGIVTILGVTQTLSWGSTFYLPAVIAEPICNNLHISQAGFFGIFSASLLLSGILGPKAGRMIDHYGGRCILAATNVIFAIGLAALATATGIASLAVAWALIGIGMGFGLYEASFATATAIFGAKARGAITGITLFAGFASTIGWPATALFLHVFGWRGACLTWAALQILLGLPLNLLIPKMAAGAVNTIKHDIASPSVTGTPITMIVLAGVFAACWFVSVAFASNLPRLLQMLGASPTQAIAAASLVGPAQVGARLIEFVLLQRASPLISARLATILHPIGAACLAFFGAPAAVLFTILHGGGNGLQTIARGTLPLALFGPAGYGLRTGVLAAPGRILQGGAPLLFSLVLDRGGPYLALLLSGTLTSLAFMALMFVKAPSPKTKDG